MPHLIELTDISRRFLVGDTVVQALKHIHLRVDEGEYLAVLGPSGSGKSTLMNLLGCMDHVQSGKYFLAGLPVHRLHDRQLSIVRNRMIGFIFQRYHLIPTYTVLQNVMMPLLVRGASHREAQLAALEQLVLLGMGERVRHSPRELSGGQQQRVAIARALVGGPKLLLADEPTGALDSNTGGEVMRLFERLHDRGHTIVMITHDSHIASYAERTVRIVDGELYS